MSDTIDPAAAAGQASSTDGAAVTPPAQTTPSLSLADVQRLMAEERAKLTADFDQKQAQREAAIRAEMQAALRAKGKTPAKTDPTPPVPPIDPPAPLPVPEEDPAIAALRTEQQATAQKYAELEKMLKAEQGKREAAEESAQKAERFKAVYDALTDLENPSRTDPDGGQMAAKWLLSQHKIKHSTQTGGYFVAERDPATGEEKTTPIKTWIAQWGQTKEGQRFRPPIPSGAGTTPGFLPGGTPPKDRAALTVSEQIAASRQKDQTARRVGLN